VPDEKGVVADLKAVVELAEVRRNAVTLQFDVGNELVRDLMVADEHGDLRCRIAAVDDAPEAPPLRLSEDDWLLVGVHHCATCVQ